jgi:hypothetical protein
MHDAEEFVHTTLQTVDLNHEPEKLEDLDLLFRQARESLVDAWNAFERELSKNLSVRAWRNCTSRFNPPAPAPF